VNAGSTGTSGTFSIAALDNFVGTITLSCPSTFGAGSCSVSPASVSSFPATATLTINGSSFTAGAYSISITGTSGSIIHSLAVPFNVGDYSVSGTNSVSGVPGQQATAGLTLTSSYSYNGKINATCDATTSLAGAMCTLTPGNPISVTSGGTANLTVTINVPNNAVPGGYNVKVSLQDTTGSPTHSATIALTVAQDFIVTSSTTSQSVTAGQTSGPYALRVQPVGASFSDAVNLACTSGLPSGAQCVFNPSTPVTPGNSAVDVVMNIATKAAMSDWKMPAIGYIAVYASWLLLPGVVLVGELPRRVRAHRLLFLSTVMLMLTSGLWLLPSCAGVSNSGGGGNPPPTSKTYHITVTGSSAGTPADAGQSTTVTLVVN